jgi:hypothetical protein
MTMNRLVMAAGITLLAGAGGTAQAANWLMLQGTEPAGAAERARPWGFIQVQYQKDYSDPNAAGAYVPPKLIGPNLESQETFNVNRARIGLRGANFPLDDKTNYFILAEFGNNGITAKNGADARLTDASVTFNHIRGARVRAGLFKYPGAEEGLQAIHVFDYINFSSVSNQLLLERFPNRQFTGNVPPQDIPPQTPFNGFDAPVGAFRDVGVEVFDAFHAGAWEHSYAVMYGNGNGLDMADRDDHKDLYLYLSTERVYGGKGPRRQGLKFFVWNQSGKRSYDGNNDGIAEAYDRDRSGIGVKYLRNPWRATAEYMEGEGMIFNGPDKPSFGLVPPSVGNPDHPANGLNAKASGWYVEGGWRVPDTRWELDLRYDIYNRLKDSPFELEFKTTTAGVQYFFNKKTRVALNYSMRDFEAVDFGADAGPNQNLKGVDDRLAIQVTSIF